MKIPGQTNRLEIAARTGKQVHEAVTETILGTPMSTKYKVTLHDTISGKDVTEAYHKDALQAMQLYPSINARINGKAIKAIRHAVNVPARFSADPTPHLEEYCKSLIVAARARAAGMTTFEVETEPENVVRFRPQDLERATGYRPTKEMGLVLGQRISAHILQEQQESEFLKPIAHVDEQLLGEVMHEVRKHDAMHDLVPIDMQFRHEGERQAVNAHYDELLMKHHKLVPIGSSVDKSRKALPKLVPIGSQQPARVACHGNLYYLKMTRGKDEEEEEEEENKGPVIEEIDAPIRSSGLPSIDGLFSDLNPQPTAVDPLQKRVTLMNKEGSPRGRSLVADSYHTRQAGRFIEFRTRNGDNHVIQDHRIHSVNGRVQAQRVKCVTSDDNSLYIHFE